MMNMVIGGDEHVHFEAQRADRDVDTRKVGVDGEALPQQRHAVPFRDSTCRFAFGEALFPVDFGIVLDCGCHSSWSICT